LAAPVVGKHCQQGAGFLAITVLEEENSLHSNLIDSFPAILSNTNISLVFNNIQP